jgi:hypothetical protein
VRGRRNELAGAEPLPPRVKWRAITLATLVLVPAYWSLLGGVVSAALDGKGPAVGPMVAFGLALVPFALVVLAFLSQHPRASSAALKAMGMALLVGIPVSALTVDAVTGLVAGAGAGGAVALRWDLSHRWKSRALAVAAVSAYEFVLVRTAGAAALLLAPILPFTALGVADHMSERRRQREEAEASVARAPARPPRKARSGR